MDKKRRTGRAKRIGYLQNFLLTCLPVVGFLLFTMVPMALSVGMSFFDMKSPLISEGTFVGLGNFRAVLFGEHAALFWQSILNTFRFWFNVPFSMAIGLAISYLLSRDIKGRKVFRVIFFIPYVCSLVAVVLMFRMMYETNYGIINTFLAGFGIQNIPWVTSPKYFMLSVTLMQTWKNVGFCVILFSAAMANVNRELYEAAYLDGAGARTIFLKLTLPAISPITFYLLTVCTIGALQVMGEAQIMAEDNTFVLDYSYNTAVLYIYDMAFSFPYHYGFGISAAASWVLVLIILLITRVSFRLSKRWVHYEF